MNNEAIAQIFREMSVILAAKDVQFKPRAYEKAADILKSYPTDIKEIYERGGINALKEIPGIGESLAEHIVEFLKMGRVPEHDRLKKSLPVNFKELLRLEGLGPKKIVELYKELKIKDLKSLAKAAKAHKISQLPHFGPQSEANILRGLEFLKKASGRWILGYILPIAKKMLTEVKNTKGVKKAEVAGSIRRRQETIGDIDILVVTTKPQLAIERFVTLPEVAAVTAKGPTRASVRLKIGVDADIRVLKPAVFGAALQYFTGDKAHNIKVRSLALKKGLTLSEYGLFTLKGKKLIAAETEEEIYQRLGMDYPEPEIRTDSGEVEAALKHDLPKLIPYGSLKGDLQVTTNWTDGNASIMEMAETAMKLGLEYIAITDHTKSLAMTGGLDEKGLAKQGAEIDKLNKKLAAAGKKFRILKSAEINILKDGSLDIADSALKNLDVVSVAVHSLFKMPKAEMTKRIIKALSHPLVNILFHPTGRLIQKREPYELDMEEVIRAAKKYYVALELDSYPERVDLRDVHVRQAVQAGIKITIDSDSHAPSHLQYLELGVATARRAWATKSDVLNTLPAEKLLAWFKNK